MQSHEIEHYSRNSLEKYIYKKMIFYWEKNKKLLEDSYFDSSEKIKEEMASMELSREINWNEFRNAKAEKKNMC